MTNKEIILDFYENVFNRWDLSGLDAVMRDDRQEAAAQLLGLPCTAEFRALDEQCGWRAWKECRLP